MAAIISLSTLLCAPSHIIEESMKRLGEVPIIKGITLDMEVLTLYANPRTKTFSVVVSKANGIACLVVGGIAYTVTVKGVDI